MAAGIAYERGVLESYVIEFGIRRSLSLRWVMLAARLRPSDGMRDDSHLIEVATGASSPWRCFSSKNQKRAVGPLVSA